MYKSRKCNYVLSIDSTFVYPLDSKFCVQGMTKRLKQQNRKGSTHTKYLSLPDFQMSLKWPRSVHNIICINVRFIDFGSFICPMSAYGCQRLWIEVAFLIQFFVVFPPFVVVFCFLLFLFYGFDWYSYRLRLRLTSFAMQLQTETRNAAACAEQQPVAVAVGVAGLPNWVSDSLIVWFRFWPTRIKYIYLMHLQNIDDVQRCCCRCRCSCHCLSFWWEACGSAEHLTRLGAQFSSAPNTAEAALRLSLCLWRIFYACMTYHHRFTLNFNNCELSVCSLFLSKMKMKCRH